MTDVKVFEARASALQHLVSTKDVKGMTDVKVFEARDLAGPARAEWGHGVPASERAGGSAGA